MKKYFVILSAILLLALCGCAQAATPEIKETAAGEEEKEALQEDTGGESADKPAAEGAQDSEGSRKEAQKEEKSEVADTAAAKGTEQNIKATVIKAADEKEADKKEEDGKESAKSETKKAEPQKKAEEKKLPKYTVTAFEEPKTMYASNPVNVRKGPTTDFERVGGLNRAQEVTATGQADTGWYEIVYGEEKAYVSGHYLQNEVPAEEPQPEEQPQTGQEQPQTAEQPQQQPQPVQAVTEVKNVAGVIMVGDSRFVQMQANIGENSCTWIAESGKGYNWFNENAVARIDGCVGKGSKILINLGVNDPGNMKNYAELVNAKAAEWVAKGAKVYYASVNPVWENPYVTEEQVEYFNSQLQGSLSGDVHWIDSHSYLDSIGYKLVDGLHFNAETYQNLYAYFMSCL